MFEEEQLLSQIEGMDEKDWLLFHKMSPLSLVRNAVHALVGCADDCVRVVKSQVCILIVDMYCINFEEETSIIRSTESTASHLCRRGSTESTFMIKSVACLCMCV
eukprot:965645_1